MVVATCHLGWAARRLPPPKSLRVVGFVVPFWNVGGRLTGGGFNLPPTYLIWHAPVLRHLFPRFAPGEGHSCREGVSLGYGTSALVPPRRRSSSPSSLQWDPSLPNHLPSTGTSPFCTTISVAGIAVGFVGQAPPAHCLHLRALRTLTKPSD